jgi:hypothetical protein
VALPAKQQQQVDYEARKAQQRRLRSLERRIPELEARCQQLEHALNANQIALAEAYEAPAGGNKAEDLLAAQQALQQELDQGFSEWEATEAEYQQLLQETAEG